MDRLLPPPLLRRSRLRPGESLLSLLARLVPLNYYDEVPTLLARLCLDGRADRLAHPGLAATYERIAALTGIAAGELYGATWHSFAPLLAPPGIELAQVELPGRGALPLLPYKLAGRLLRPESMAQYCPACLTEAAYHRLAWLPVAAAACPRHECLLVTGCPRCGADVPAQAVALARCSRCGADLRQARSVSVAGDEHGLFVQRVIHAWLTAAPPPAADSRSRTWPAQPPNVLFRVLDGLRWAVESALRTDPAWEYACPVPAGADGGGPALRRTRLSSAASYRVYATAFQALLDWPQGFHEFLRAYNFQEKRRNEAAALEADDVRYWRVDRRGLHADLGALYSQWVQWRWQHPAFAFLQEAFDQYAADTYVGSVAIVHSRRYLENPAFADRFPCASEAEAARMLNTTEQVISRLLLLGRLEHYQTSDGHYLDNFIRRKELLELRERWREPVTLAEAARLLGVNRRLVVRMVQAGVLTAERGPGSDGGTRWMFSRQVLDEFLGELKPLIRRTSPEFTSSEHDLAGAARAVAVVGLGAVDILKRVREGRLQAYSRSSPLEVPVLAQLRFDKYEIDALVGEIRAERGWISRKDAARRLGIKPTVLSKWVRAGLLDYAATPGPAWHFDQEDVRRVIADHVFTDEAAEILGVGSDTVLRWARLGRLVPVVGPAQGCHRYLFRREDVERLRRETRLTAPQLARRMGISRGHVLRLVRQGKLKPVSGPGIDGCKHFLFAVPPEEAGPRTS